MLRLVGERQTKAEVVWRDNDGKPQKGRHCGDDRVHETIRLTHRKQVSRPHSMVESSQFIALQGRWDSRKLIFRDLEILFAPKPYVAGARVKLPR